MTRYRSDKLTAEELEIIDAVLLDEAHRLDRVFALDDAKRLLDIRAKLVNDLCGTCDGAGCPVCNPIPELATWFRLRVSMAGLHVLVLVYAGSDPEHLAWNGQLTLSRQEWKDFRKLIGSNPNVAINYPTGEI